MAESQLRGILFDLDGTLVDSALDFEAIRRDMELPPGEPILEALEAMPPARARACWEILERHEAAGAARATLMPGAREFLAELDRRNLKRAIITRNKRQLTLELLHRLELQFDPVVARGDAPAKPDPTALLDICRHWGCQVSEVVMVGDFHFDIEAGRRAGVRTVLFTADRPADMPWAHEADFHLPSFHHATQLLTHIEAQRA